MSQDPNCPFGGKSPIAARVELWCDGWAPSGRDCDKARSVFEDQFRTMLSEIFDEINRRAEGNMLKTGKLEGSHYAAMTQVRAELCGERKP